MKEEFVMSENMKKFLEMASKDENLKNKLMELEKMEPAEAIRTGIALAKEHGIELSEADFAKDEIGSGLSDDELKAVAGGIIGYDRPQNEIHAWARRTHCTGQTIVYHPT